MPGPILEHSLPATNYKVVTDMSQKSSFHSHPIQYAKGSFPFASI